MKPPVKDDSAIKGGKHGRFYLSLGVGVVAAGLSLGWALPWAVRVLIAADMFFCVYIGLLVEQTGRLTPDALRRHAADSDEGLPVILVIALSSIGISVTAIFLVLNAATGPNLAETVLALISVPLGWAMIHTLLSLHYAHLFYARGDTGRDVGGMAFPGTKTPGIRDFLYFSFVIGMTAQVSDVTVSNGDIRQTVLLHSVGAFFYNTVILALAVNAGVTLAALG